jgi:hypothetical protein
LKSTAVLSWKRSVIDLFFTLHYYVYDFTGYEFDFFSVSIDIGLTLVLAVPNHQSHGLFKQRYFVCTFEFGGVAFT